MSDPAELREDGPASPEPPEARREKSPQAFRTISEVSEELAIPPHVLRFWESKFPQLNPMKRGGGRRYYRPADVALLKGIRTMLYDEGLTIKGLQKVFRERGPRHVAGVGEGIEAPAPVAPEDRTDGAAEAQAEFFLAESEAAADAEARIAAAIRTLEAIRDRLRAG